MKKLHYYQGAVSIPFAILIIFNSGYCLIKAFIHITNPFKQEFWDVYSESFYLFKPVFMLLWLIGMIVTFLLLYIFRNKIK